MFSGIIEAMAKVEKIEREGSNIHFTFSCPFTEELHIDQSVAHNGVCLTVVNIEGQNYTVTAIQETLDKTNLGELTIGGYVNLERSVTPDTRMDGHYVQGHVDTVAKCTSVKEVDGSWYYEFEIDNIEDALLMVDKGSISINGTSLTLVKNTDKRFSVAIIPYTFENTTFKYIKEGTIVNIEYDVMGKYIAKYLNSIRHELTKKG
jgi:riboflavin synthase